MRTTLSLRAFLFIILSVCVLPTCAAAGETPDLTILYSWNFVQVQEGSVYDFQIGPPARPAVYSWPNVMFGPIFGFLYKGRIHENAQLVGGHKLVTIFLTNGEMLNKVEFDQFPEPGDYFAVIWNGSNGLNATQENLRVQHWFESGTSVDPNATPPGSWGIIKFRVGEPNTAPEITGLQQFERFEADPLAEGGTFIGNSITMKATVADAEDNNVRLEVEVKQVDESFNGENTTLSDSVTPGELSVDIAELIPPPEQTPAEGYQNAFHWRARAIDTEGEASDWQEFGGADNTDFVADYTIGFAASSLARQLIDQSDAYELGARGWDYNLDAFANPAGIINGYSYLSGLTGNEEFGPGIDCSGLIYWSYNKSVDPHKSDGNYVANITANGMFVEDGQSDPVTESYLQPGDALFFNNDSDPDIDHVAMYVGESGGYDVVNAGNEAAGVTRESREIFADTQSFSGYRHMHQNGFEGIIEGSSPIDVIVTDPEGNTLSFDDILSSDEESIREIPGKLYYSEVRKGHDGHPKDVVYIPKLTEGAYRVVVVPDAEADPSETYSLKFTAGSSTIMLAEDAPLTTIPEHGFGIVVSSDGSLTLDQTPPEARFSFDTLDENIEITGTDDLSATTVARGSTTTVIADEAGNTLMVDVARDITQARHAALVMPSFAYSSGTSTNATTSIRYFWVPDRKGAYTLFVSAIKTPTERLLAVYSKRTDKTHIIDSTPEDDDEDLSLKSALLLLRKKLKTYPGLVIPSVRTNQGMINLEI